ncbi:MAG: site-2 protease family protein [Gemmatimonadales bacterium]
MESQIAEGLIYFVVFLFSTTLHEAAHAWTAHRLGDSTAYHGGQVSLSPIPHIRRSPMGMLVIPLISVAVSGWPIGFASAPYNVAWSHTYPRRAALMSLAGPGANALLFIAAGLAIRIGAMTGIFSPPGSVTFGHLVGTDPDGWNYAVGFLLGAVFSMNLLLMVFNLIPLPPLDGSGAIPIFLDEATGQKYLTLLHRAPGLALLGLVVSWQVINTLFHPIFLAAVNLIYPGVTYG